jgi:hypothetical protein
VSSCVRLTESTHYEFFCVHNLQKEDCGTQTCLIKNSRNEKKAMRHLFGMSMAQCGDGFPLVEIDENVATKIGAERVHYPH